jgi:hypothetical protein
MSQALFCGSRQKGQDLGLEISSMLGVCVQRMEGLGCVGKEEGGGDGIMLRVPRGSLRMTHETAHQKVGGVRRRRGCREKEEEADITERNLTRRVWLATHQKMDDGERGTRRGH